LGSRLWRMRGKSRIFRHEVDCSGMRNAGEWLERGFWSVSSV
jgi:hypothetical protein